MNDDDCECICNHSGACTGCGICWVEAYAQQQKIWFGLPIQPIGWQGAAQHTYTPACDGFHPPGRCPPR
jgi:hypothetical protein